MNCWHFYIKYLHTSPGDNRQHLHISGRHLHARSQITQQPEAFGQQQTAAIFYYS